MILSICSSYSPTPAFIVDEWNSYFLALFVPQFRIALWMGENWWSSVRDVLYRVSIWSVCREILHSLHRGCQNTLLSCVYLLDTGIITHWPISLTLYIHANTDIILNQMQSDLLYSKNDYETILGRFVFALRHSFFYLFPNDEIQYLLKICEVFC